MLSRRAANLCPGREATGTSDPVPTDPFMMFIAPIERCETSSGLATANFCVISGKVQVSVWNFQSLPLHCNDNAFVPI